MNKILLVDDDLKICEITSKYLEHAGYEVKKANDGETAQKFLENENYDFIIFDVMLPDISGFELLDNLRNGEYVLSQKSASTETPVIMLTALGQTQNIIKGLKGGADDYITKPFDPAELVERIAVVLRRTRKNSITNEIIELGGLNINLTSCEVSCNSKPIELKPREYNLLICLSKNPKKVYGREELINSVWGWDFEGSDRAVDICIQRLRSKIKQSKAKINIKTIWGTGYKLEVTD